jgi:hypothetical protein
MRGELGISNTFLYSYLSEYKNDTYSLQVNKTDKGPIILFLTAFYSRKLEEIWWSNYVCPYKCYYTSDAFNIFLTLEPPTKTYFRISPYVESQFRDYFNPTFIYRFNSDLYHPYDAFIKFKNTDNQVGRLVYIFICIQDRQAYC